MQTTIVITAQDAESCVIGTTETLNTFRSARVGCGYDYNGRKTIKIASIEAMRPIVGISARFVRVTGEVIKEEE